MSIEDGGPFHPCEVSWNDGEMTGGIQTGNRSGIHTGASLRDHFAGLAMQAIIIANREEIWRAIVCDSAYLYADEMLRAREAGQ